MMRRGIVLLVAITQLAAIAPQAAPARADASPAPDGAAGEAQGATAGAAAAAGARGERWSKFFHGYAFLISNRQGGRLSSRGFESANHFMTGASRPLGGGTLSLLGTFTIEPATIPPEGSGLLFQRGETYGGALLVDRQHPHDLFVELAARWERSLSKNTGLLLYAAPRGEPAVGPTAYPHRSSASENPTAPLAHHNQDSTHISADVVTVGIRAFKATVEGSGFHGREPDENRWDLEQCSIDSYAGRLTVRPGGGLAIQVSAARRKDPEAIEEGDQTRQTFSIEYSKPTTGGFLAASLILGRNLLPGNQLEWGNGLEATWKFRQRNFLYGRIESTDRDMYELVNKTSRPASVPPARTTVQTGTIGYVRDLPLLHEAETGAGAGVTVYRFESSLDPIYGAGPVSLQLFLRVRFGAHGGVGHAGMHH